MSFFKLSCQIFGKWGLRADDDNLRSILFTAGGGYMSDLRDAFTARAIRRIAGRRGEEEKEAETGRGWVNERSCGGRDLVV